MVAIASISCTDNRMARKFGGKHSINLEANQKLENITWKGDNLWILTRNMSQKDNPQTYTFKEESSWGVLEGEIIIVESRDDNIVQPSSNIMKYNVFDLTE